MYGVIILYHIMPHSIRFLQVLKLNREDMRAAQSISKEDSGAVTDGDGSKKAIGHDGTIQQK